MRKRNGSAPGRAAEPELLKVNGQHSTINRRRIQELFTASQKPDRLSVGQPSWFVGTRELTYHGGATTRLDVFISLCAECGAPFITQEPSGRPVKWPNRRCELHRHPGAAVSEFTPRWTVDRGAP